MKKAILFIMIAVIIAMSISGCKQTDNTQAVTTKTAEKTETAETAYAGGEMSCTDTDSGKTKETKGTVSGVDIDGNAYEFEDKCVETWLIEYFCDGNEYKNQNFICENDCKKGACI